MTRNLEQAIARFDAAADTRISTTGVSWREYEDFLSAMNHLDRTAHQLLLPRDVSDFVWTLRRARRQISAIPIHPADPSLGLADALSFHSDSAGEQMSSSILRCQQAIAALINVAEHPGLGELRLHAGKVRDRRPEALFYAVVARDNVDVCQKISEENDLGLNVLSFKDAKWTAVGDVCYLFGMPERVLGATLNWIEAEDAEKEISWLFNSPIANQVAVITWPGNRQFSIDRYTVFPGLNLNLSAAHGLTKFNYDFLKDDSFVSSSPPPTIHLEDSDSEPVNATAFRLSNDLWVFYSNDDGPRPDRIEETDFELTVAGVKNIHSLQLGDILLVHSGDASREYLNAEADRFLEETYGSGQAERSGAVRNQYRDGIRQLRRQPDGEKKLKAAGLSDIQIQYRFRLVHDHTHIAPEKKEDFILLSSICGITVGDEEWEHLRRLRGALSHAGRTARKTMKEAIQQNDSWMSVVDEPKPAVLKFEKLGSFVISRILAISPEPVLVPISRLGLLEKRNTSQ